MQISQKTQMYIGAAVAVITLAGKGSITLPVGIPPEAGVVIASWANFILQIYAVLAPILLAYGGSQPGILAPPDPPVVVAAQKVADASSVGQLQSAKAQAIAAIQSHAGAFLAFLMASLLILALAPGVARAQAAESPTEFNTRNHAVKAAPAQTPAANPNATTSGGASSSPAAVPCTDLLNLLPPGCSSTPSAASGPLADIENFFTSDFADAAKLAIAIPTLQHYNGNICWTQASSVSALIKLHPLPVTLHAATDLEALMLLSMSINQLCANPSCTQMFTDLSNGVSQLGLGVPIPSLTAICAKVPLITPGSPPTTVVVNGSVTNTPSTTQATPATPAPAAQ